VLRPGGRLVYSTCSLNPIENEAVVSAALRELGADPANGVAGKLRVVDVSDLYPMLKRCKGLTHWRVAPGSGRHLTKEEPKEEKASTAPAADATAPAEAGEASAAAAPAPGSAEYLAALPTTRWVESYEALQAVDKSLASRTPRTAWPCGQEKAMGLEHAMRVYPHHQNTGGFFVCVLELEGERDEEGQAAGMIRAMEAKDRQVEAEAGPSTSAELQGEASSSAAASSIKRALSPSADAEEPEGKRLREDEPQEDAAEADLVVADPNASIKPDNHAAARATRGKKNDRDEGYGMPGGVPWKEDPFTFVDWRNAQTQSVLDFYGVKPEFPKHNFLVRNLEGEPLRTVYMTSSSVRAIVSSGGPGINGHPSLNPRKMRMLNCGVKTLARQEAGKDKQLECRWRAIADGAPVIRPMVRDEMIARAELSDLAFLIKNHYPTLESTPDSPFFREMRTRKMGSYFADFVPGEHEGTKLSTTLNYPVWRAVASINLMLDKQEKR
jgi:multisite-specific tRNA:(cytosine-C5)-methyltransferase